ncbi:hypothetical protein [Streptomyces olivoreticuli]|uniref:hypothetical protein n=1 Tax=Streptomyces olivoreticuli TaxID=68246 RepID=UPI000E244785|nr:hypothetical protein [Streptomyces olivoreticuli]
MTQLPEDTSPAQPDWTSMGRAAFDTEAPNEPPVPAPVRIIAAPDRYGTAALFGEEPPPSRPTAKQPAPNEGQDALFSLTESPLNPTTPRTTP